MHRMCLLICALALSASLATATNTTTITTTSAAANSTTAVTTTLVPSTTASAAALTRFEFRIEHSTNLLLVRRIITPSDASVSTTAAPPGSDNDPNAGPWGTVCDDGMTVSTATALATLAGFTNISRVWWWSRDSTSEIILDEVSCPRNATDLSRDCKFIADNHDCDAKTESVALMVIGEQTPKIKYQFQLPSDTVLRVRPLPVIKDDDGSDKNGKNTAVAAAAEPVFGTVCLSRPMSSRVSSLTARALCFFATGIRDPVFPRISTVPTSRAAGPIWLADVQCNVENATNFETDCTYSIAHDCLHDSDLALTGCVSPTTAAPIAPAPDTTRIGAESMAAMILPIFFFILITITLFGAVRFIRARRAMSLRATGPAVIVTDDNFNDFAAAGIMASPGTPRRRVLPSQDNNNDINDSHTAAVMEEALLRMATPVVGTVVEVAPGGSSSSASRRRSERDDDNQQQHAVNDDDAAEMAEIPAAGVVAAGGVSPQESDQQPQPESPIPVVRGYVPVVNPLPDL